jgi:cytochrome c biogenesis protein CcmG, thiol:disulfide interchange protein DsbE
MMRRVLFLLPVAAFAALAAYFALALRPGYDPQQLPSALIDKPAPAFNLARLNGDGTLSAAALRGQVVVVNFFASWCVPCRLEHPLLMRLAASGQVAIYGIAYKDKTEDSLRILAQLGDPYRAIGVDREGRTGFDFGVYGVPETYVIDRDGHIRQRFVGPLTAETVERELLPLVKRLAAS